MKIAVMIGVVCVAILACGGEERLREAEKQLSIAEYEKFAATAIARRATPTAKEAATARYECNMKIAAAILMVDTDPVYVIVRDGSSVSVPKLHAYQIWRNPERFPEKFADLRDRWSSEDPLIVEWADAALPFIDKWRRESTLLEWDWEVLVEGIRSGEC